MTIVWGRWEAYPWKNELAVQSERVTIHFNEILSDSFEGQHNPFDMLDRAIVLSGFAVRRMIEKRLVTDRLAKAKIPVRTFTRSGADGFRAPFHSDTGVYPLHENYNLEKESAVDLSFMELANEIIHASQIMVVHDEPKMGDGLLVASDWHLKNCILFLAIDEFQSFVRTVLEDRIRMAADSRDFETGKADAKRE